MDPDQLQRWMAGYEQAWRAPGTEMLAQLFTREARYSPAPFDEVVAGLAAIERFWEAERDGPGESFQMTWEPVAMQDDTAVVRVAVRYAGPPPRRYRDLWVITFDSGGRCRRFEEWPFFPDRPRAT